jgi:ubiquitin-protein ligase E3 C
MPLLLNRLPLTSITKLSASIPYSRLDILDPSFLNLLPTDLQVNLLANVVAVVTPRYSLLPRSSLKVYMDLIQRLITGIPSALIGTQTNQQWHGAYSDDDSEGGFPVVSGPAVDTSLDVQIDSRTLSRINSLRNRNNLQALLAAAGHSSDMSSSVVTFCLSLCELWPSERDLTLGLCIGCLGTAFLREIYREHVRTSPLGKREGVIPNGTNNRLNTIMADCH